jgi:hypothetical protein
MKTMKKLTALLLALAMVFSLAACAEGGGKTDLFGSSEPATTAAKTEPTKENTATTEKPATAAPTTEAPTAAPTTEAPSAPNGDDPFAAISNAEINADLVGTWVYTVDYGKVMESAAGSEELAQLGEMGEALMSAFSNITMDVVLDLRADGSCTFGIDEESARAAVEAMVPALVEALLPSMASMSGMTEEQFAEALKQQGMTVEQFGEQLAAQVASQMNPDEMVAQIKEATREGYWRIADGKLYVVDEGKTADPEKYMTVQIGNGVLTVTSVPNGDASEEMYKAMLPMEFTRK